LCDQRLGQRPFGNHRHLDGFRPEREQVIVHHRAVAQRRLPQRAEGDVIGPRLGRGHAVMTRGAAERADDGIPAQFLAGMTHGAGTIRQVDPVQPVTCDQK